jgi:hypothetical protein
MAAVDNHEGKFSLGKQRPVWWGTQDSRFRWDVLIVYYQLFWAIRIFLKFPVGPILWIP